MKQPLSIRIVTNEQAATFFRGACYRVKLHKPTRTELQLSLAARCKRVARIGIVT